MTNMNGHAAAELPEPLEVMMEFHFGDAGGVRVMSNGQVEYTGVYVPQECARQLWENLAAQIYPILPMALDKGRIRALALFDRVQTFAGLLQHDRAQMRTAFIKCFEEEIVAAELRGVMVQQAQSNQGAKEPDIQTK